MAHMYVYTTVDQNISLRLKISSLLLLFHFYNYNVCHHIGHEPRKYVKRKRILKKDFNYSIHNVEFQTLKMYTTDVITTTA